MYQASDIAKYFIHYANLEEDGMMTNLKLQKLLYYAQGNVLANLTHQQKPWVNTGLNQTITHELMSDYFKSQIVNEVK